MNIFGSIPDWLSFALALLAFFGFAINQREKTILGKSNTVSSNQNNEDSLTEKNVEIRAELYSRILIGIILGVALVPINSWVYSGSYQGNFYDSSASNYAATAESMINLFSALILSTFLSFVYFRAYPRLSSLFVHWVERFAISYVGFWFILLASFVRYDREAYTYFLYTDKFVSVIVCVTMLVLISFPSTPIDWIITLASRLGTKKT